MKIDVCVDILRKNEETSNEINKYLNSLGIKTINLLGSPGSGKTTFLEKVLPLFNKDEVYVIEGDLFSELDSRRVEALGVKSIQLNTNGACHLESYMILDALKEMDLSGIKYIFIDNIGNLVCTASYNLGEDIRIVVTSVTEGNDKPIKYPKMFRLADYVLLNKIDLVNLCDFDINKFNEDVLLINESVKIINISAKNNINIEEVYNLIK